MRSKKILWTVALTALIFQSTLLTTVHATTMSSHRLSGDNRYETSSIISQRGWTTSDTVILVNGENFADALSAGPLAQKYNAPILLTSSLNISDEILSEISRLKAKNVIIIGGTGAVSVDIETKLKSKGYTSINRIAGIDRYETSALIAAKLDKPTAVVIAPGENFPDALSIASVASKLGMPILLSSKDGLSDYAEAYIKNNGIAKTYIVGGEGSLSAIIENQVPSPKRLAGIDRYGTNLAIMKEFESNLNFDNVYLATGNEFADALSGAALASITNSPIILADQTIDKTTNDYLKGKVTLNTKAIALGGEAIVADSLVQKVTDDKADMSVTKTYSSQGSFNDGIINGSVVISSAGVFLKNTTIKGDLLIASTVGDGTVDLDNVTVAGKIVVNGGGENSIDFHHMDVKTVELDKPTGNKVRIATDATSSITSLMVNSNGIVDETNSSKAGNVTINQQSNVILKGKFDVVEVIGKSSNMNLQSGSINTLNVSSTATGSTVNMDKTTTVTTLNLNAAISVTGTGTITNANVGVSGTTIETKPTNMVVVAGVTVSVAGETKNDNNTKVITNGTTETTSSSGATSSETSSSGTITSLNSIEVTTPANKLVYTVGDSLDLTGLVVTGTYSDGSKVVKPVLAANITGFNSSMPAINQLLTITVEGKIITYSITINAVTSNQEIALNNIEITTPANKLVYTTGDLLDLTGLVVTGIYSDGSKVVKPVLAVNITGFNSSTPVVNQLLTITVEGKTTTYSITVNAANSISSSVTNVIVNASTSSNLITIQGNVSTGSGKEVTIQVLDPDGTLDFIGEVTSVEFGKFTFTFKASTVVSGNYTVKLGGYGISTPYQQNFIFSN